jgi:exonuclease III
MPGGDFNFVQSVQQNRRTSRQSHSAGRSTAAAWQQQLQQLQLNLVDAYRHPQATTFTHFHPAGAARLDRFYISSSLLPCLAAATIGERLPSTAGALISDHRPSRWPSCQAQAGA